MKIIQSIFVCFALNVIVEGNMLVNALRGGIIEPIILSFGAAFTAFNIHGQSDPEEMKEYIRREYQKYYKEKQEKAEAHKRRNLAGKNPPSK